MYGCSAPPLGAWQSWLQELVLDSVPHQFAAAHHVWAAGGLHRGTALHDLGAMLGLATVAWVFCHMHGIINVILGCFEITYSENVFSKPRHLLHLGYDVFMESSEMLIGLFTSGSVDTVL